MGLNLQDLFGQVKDGINNGIQQVETVGVPALTASAEQWGAQVLTQQAKESQSAVNAAIAAQPAAAPGSFAASIQGTFKNAVASNYAVPMMLGLLAVAYLIVRKV